MNTHFFFILVLLINSFFGCDCMESSPFQTIAELAKGIVSAAANRHLDKRRTQNSKCSSESCKLAINISALAVSQQFSELVHNLGHLEVLHIRFDDVNVPSTYDRHRRRAIHDFSSFMVDSGNGTFEKIDLPERYVEWTVFDPLWWMWAVNDQHYVFKMPLLDIDILSSGKMNDSSIN